MTALPAKFAPVALHRPCTIQQLPGLKVCMLRHADSGGPSEGKQEEEAKEWVDDGSLPLEDGKLPFFLLDAHEEPGTPGTLYLFGKVLHTQHLHPTSCYSSLPQQAWGGGMPGASSLSKIVNVLLALCMACV